jgi:hypothetical protein
MKTRGNADPDLAPVGLHKRPSGTGIELLEWTRGQCDPGIGRLGASDVREGPNKGGRRRLIGTLVQGGQRQRLPEQLAQPSCLSMPDQPASDGLARRRGPDTGHAGELAAGETQGAGEPEDRAPVAKVESVPLEQTGQQVQRGTKRRADEPGTTAGRIDRGHIELGLQAQVARRPDPRQEPPGLVVAPEQDVLTVINQLTGHAVPERGRPSAQPCPGFEDDDPATTLGQGRRRAQSGEPGADDDDIVCPALGVHSCVLSQTVAAIQARRGRGIRTTSEKMS